MSEVPTIRLDERLGPFPGSLTTEVVREYAAATGDDSPAVIDGDGVPPVAIVTQIWDAVEAGRTIAADVEATMQGGVQGEHDVVLHRPIVPGEPLQTWVQGWSARPAGRNALVTLRYETHAADGGLVAEQWWTTVYLGTTCATVGPGAPDHAFPEPARERLVAQPTIEVDDQMAHRYAAVSGDWSAHHFEVEAARLSGAARPFLHGMCTMALCARAVTATVADGDPGRIRRIAVRFAATAPVGEDVTVGIYDAGDGTYAFEASAAGALVITHGRAELRA